MPDFQEGDIVTLIDDDLGEGVILGLFLDGYSARVVFADGDAVHWVPITRLRFERRPERASDDAVPGGA